MDSPDIVAMGFSKNFTRQPLVRISRHGDKEMTIYWLLNNDYHYHDFQARRSQFTGAEHALILLPHRLDVEQAERSVQSSYLIQPASNQEFVPNLLHGLRHRRVVERIPVASTDVLHVYNGEELLSHLVVRYFRKRGARVCMVEDGPSTHQLYLTHQEYSKKAGNKLKTAIYRATGFGRILYRDFNGISYPVFENRMIDEVILRYSSPYEGDLSTRHMPFSGERIPGLNDDTALFLTQPLYEDNTGYSDFDDYVACTAKVLQILVAKFRNVYFKFHPRDDGYTKATLLKMIDSIRGIKVVDSNLPVERLYDVLRPGYCISYISWGLFNAVDVGIKAVFLYPLLGEISIRENRYLAPLIEQINGIVIQDLDELMRFDPFGAISMNGACGRQRNGSTYQRA